MNGFVAMIEKWQPAFKKLAANKYLSSIRDGFIALMPIVLFSSLFLLIANIPLIWGYHLPTGLNDALNKFYNYSMGLMGMLAAGTVAKALGQKLNLELSKTNQMPITAVQFTANIAYFMAVVDPVMTKTGVNAGINFASGYMGTKGLIAAFVVGFIVPNIYKFCFKRNLTVKMPPQVPQNISDAFKNVIPFAFATTFFWLFDIVFRALTSQNLAEWIINVLAPIFSAADSWGGLALIYGAMPFFWFIGIQGPSVVEPAIAATQYANADTNMALFKAGEHATHILTYGTQYFVATLGGTGATLMVTLLFAFFAKSKQLKAVGRAASVPVFFGVNEPILFGAPLILNPTFFFPMIVAPILNVWLFKFFVEVLNMNSFIAYMPFTMPGPIGLPLCTGFAPLAFVLAILLLVVDTIIYYPFFKAYDIATYKDELAAEAAEGAANVQSTQTESNTLTANTAASTLETAKKPEEKKTEQAPVQANNGDIPLDKVKDGKTLNVLVLCAGGGTSGILANALTKLGQNNNLPIESIGKAYGTHSDLLPDMDIVILAPQMDTMEDELRKETSQYDAKMIKTSGRQYIDWTQHAEKALKAIIDEINE
ncbi:PTS transporter subunit EIIC [Sporolactobacillus shoreicorticis]|uniref:PTS system lactose-specific EIICB component n=1 Tax=Sporolactobacillus shoreicorticis TaxID=1923877 RepID=A0ABW5S8U2_9BACL|nr:PTS transporter subunit EIIC [Sporolactobacillus shoreicorticis]MCO7127884.1 PTS transporter subunit EIIC [Sporolactobacillus shoreicorticis]